MTEVSTTKKEFAKADFSVFERTVQMLETTPAKLCDAMGYSPGSHVSWRREGKMPKVASVACEGLQRRNGIKERILIVKLPHQTHYVMLKSILDASKIEFVEI